MWRSFDIVDHGDSQVINSWRILWLSNFVADPGGAQNPRSEVGTGPPPAVMDFALRAWDIYCMHIILCAPSPHPPYLKILDPSLRLTWLQSHYWMLQCSYEQAYIGTSECDLNKVIELNFVTLRGCEGPLKRLIITCVSRDYNDITLLNVAM